MIPDKVKKYIDELIHEMIEEMDGATSTTASAGGEYSSKYFLKRPKKLEEKTPTLAAGKANISSYTKDGFKKVPEGMPSDSRMFDYKQFPAKPAPKKIKLYKEATGNVPNKGKKKGAKRFIPSEFEFPSFLLDPIKIGDTSRVYFRIATNNKGESILMIDPLVKVSLDAIERGRTSFEKEQKLSELTRFIKEKVPNGIRGLIKKASQGAKIAGNNFIPLNLILSKDESEGDDKWYVKNPFMGGKTKITPGGIQFLKDIKVDKSKGKGREDEISMLIWLYKNQDNDVTLSDFSEETDKPIQSVSAIANKLTSNGYADVEKSEYKDINVKMYESLKNMIETELLNEISYRRFAENISKVTSERKITRALNEVRKRIREIEQVIEYSNRLKTENTIKKESFWTSKTEQLNALSERLNELSNKIRNLSQ
jgi:Mn-dependent DtxR family transcriptional regulator